VADRVPCRSGEVTARILQVHPTRRCNLRCRHCYSESSPDANVDLDVSALCGALTDARALRFDVLAVSGGEPLLWAPLPTLLEHAKSLGLQTMVTSNGTLATKRRIAAVRDVIDAIVLSIDGAPLLHNEIRGHPTAFARMLAGIDAVRDAGIPFGLIHTLTARSWSDLPWVVEFAAAKGAGVLQLHPLELAGRARHEMAHEALGRALFGKSYLLSEALRVAYAGRMNIQLDLLLRRDVLAQPHYVYAGANGVVASPTALRTLVVEADGAVVPVSYGLSPRYAVADLARERLLCGWERWAQAGWKDFTTLCQAVFDDIAATPDEPVLNWHEQLVARSLIAYRRPAGVVDRAGGAGRRAGPGVRLSPARAASRRASVACGPRVRAVLEAVCDALVDGAPGRDALWLSGLGGRAPRRASRVLIGARHARSTPRPNNRRRAAPRAPAAPDSHKRPRDRSACAEHRGAHPMRLRALGKDPLQALLAATPREACPRAPSSPPGPHA
jgi:Fe-coproporphyrin III synthase